MLVVLFKNITTTKYSHSDIVTLINKGAQAMNNMENVSFEKETKTGIVKHYYKGNAMKNVSISAGKNITIITNLEKGKKYVISEEDKKIFVSNDATTIDKGIQYECLQRANTNSNSNYKYEFVYIKDEKIDNKDCIFIKEKILYKKNNEYVELSNNPEDNTCVYWIEKSTGFVIGVGIMKLDESTATPYSIIKNIKLGEVTDSDFELPSNYEIIEVDI